MQPKNPDSNVEIHAIVQGNVQGVGFRATVSYHAVRLGLVGTARNLSDGSVEIFAQGNPETIRQLFQELHQEFGSSYISKITQKEINPPRHYDGFRIVR